MGCQKEIAKTVIEDGGDYVLALKANQGNMHAQVQKHFNHFYDMKHNNQTDYYEKSEMNRGRVETRECLATSAIDWLEGKEEWKGLTSIVAIKSQRIINGETSVEYRYYLTSLDAKAENIHSAVRSHWAVENSLHWVLDMVFREDDSRVRTKKRGREYVNG